MISTRLGPDLAAELPARQAELLASDREREWILPPGEHLLTGPLTLGAAGRRLTISGQAGTLLRLQQGGLEVCGERLRLRNLRVVADAAATPLRVSGGEVALERVSASGGLAGATGDALAVSAAREARLVACGGDLRRGIDGVGVAVSAAAAQLTGVRGSAVADRATGIRVQAERELLLSDCSATGVRGPAGARGLVAVAPQIEAMSLAVSDLHGGSCSGIELYAPATGDLSALDLSATGLTATNGLCRGLFLAARGALQLSGFSVSALAGAQCHGVTAIAAGSAGVASGAVRELRGSGLGATGVRLLATDPASPVTLHDVTVEGLGGTAPRSEAQPDAAFAGWAAAFAATLDNAGFDETGLDPFPPAADAGEVVAIHIGAPADAVARARRGAPAALEVEDLVLHRIAGTALQLEAGLRPARLLRTEIWTCARAGWLQAEQLTLAKITVHRHLEALRLGPGDVRVLDSLFTGRPGGSAPQLDPDAELERVEAAFAEQSAAPWQPLIQLPYVDAGPASVPPSLADGVRPPRVAVDLSLLADADIVAEAVAVPRDPEAPFIGARAPQDPLPCGLEDPQPEAWRPPPAAADPEPPVDYRARDAKALLALMLERARTSMASWTEDGPSDFTRMLLELLAERLDHLAYEQEMAVAEGFLDIARLRRSVEDHARPLDYRPDPGLSASAMIRFGIDRDALAEAAERLAPGGDPRNMALFRALEDGAPVDIPATTLVGNQDPDEGSVLFATEAILTYLPELDAVRLAENCEPGATGMRLRGRLERLERDRWLVLSRGRGYPGHAVRITGVQLETATTWVQWDPRRPARHRYPAEIEDDGDRALAFGNVVPAHHGLPVRAKTDQESPDDLLEPWQSLLTRTIDGAALRELELPLTPVSVQAPGYPLPDEVRQGSPQIRVLVEGDEWRLVDDLSVLGPGREVFVLRPGGGDHALVRFGDGVNGAALPGRPVELRMDLTIGLGTKGNVGAFTLNRLIRFGPTVAGVADPEAMISETAGPERDDLVRTIWRVTNPLPGVGGRNPEPLERIRYRAPLQIRDALSAVTTRDYERLLQTLPEVAAARARVIDAGLRQVIRVTVLLADQDQLPEAEILRRWALVRRRLEEIRMLGFDVEAVPPVWLPLDIDLVVDADPMADSGRLREEVREAIAGNGGLLDPDTTGLGGDVRISDLYQRVQRLEGVRAVRLQRFRRLAPEARDCLDDGVIPVGDHEVASVGGPRVGGAGLLTVSVCGGLQ